MQISQTLEKLNLSENLVLEDDTNVDFGGVGWDEYNLRDFLAETNFLEKYPNPTKEDINRELKLNGIAQI